jgi:hypothetical protein
MGPDHRRNRTGRRKRIPVILSVRHRRQAESEAGRHFCPDGQRGARAPGARLNIRITSLSRLNVGVRRLWRKRQHLRRRKLRNGPLASSVRCATMAGSPVSVVPEASECSARKLSFPFRIPKTNGMVSRGPEKSIFHPAVPKHGVGARVPIRPRDPTEPPTAPDKDGPTGRPAPATSPRCPPGVSRIALPENTGAWQE